MTPDLSAVPLPGHDGLLSAGARLSAEQRAANMQAAQTLHQRFARIGFVPLTPESNPSEYELWDGIYYPADGELSGDLPPSPPGASLGVVYSRTIEVADGLQVYMDYSRISEAARARVLGSLTAHARIRMPYTADTPSGSAQFNADYYFAANGHVGLSGVVAEAPPEVYDHATAVWNGLGLDQLAMLPHLDEHAIVRMLDHPLTAGYVRALGDFMLHPSPLQQG